MVRVAVKGELLRWARERSGVASDELVSRFPKLEQWEVGKAQPTLKQLEDYAKATHTSVGLLFLPTPPEETVPIPDFRTMGGVQVTRPSPNLLEMIYACQQRQDWFRDHARTTRLDELKFVGSATTKDSVERTAAEIRGALRFDVQARARCRTWTEALRLFILQADELGVLVMCSGIVMNNTHRRLDPQEFRGFALADSLAPLVFINGADTKSAQMFTLAHELAHIWLGQTALSDSTVASREGNAVERWCNGVAAELLAPLAEVRRAIRRNEPIEQTVARLAREFKVSTLVVLQRLRDSDHITWDEFNSAYSAELVRLSNLPRPSGGGDFYATAGVRYSRRFARALFESTSEGRTLYRDAFRLLGISKTETFNELGRSLALPG